MRDHPRINEFDVAPDTLALAGPSLDAFDAFHPMNHMRERIRQGVLAESMFQGINDVSISQRLLRVEGGVDSPGDVILLSINENRGLGQVWRLARCARQV